MQRDRAQTLLAAVGAVLAFGALAATLDAGRLPGGGQSPAPPSTDPSSPEVPMNGSSGEALFSAPSCPAPLTDPLPFAAAAGVVVLGGVVLFRWRRDAALPAAVCPPVLLGLAAFCPSALPRVALPHVERSTLLLGAAALLALGALAVLTSVVTGDRASIGSSEDDAADVDLAGIADAAGDAADRIEAEAEVSNAVYRAWREMVGHLDVDSPETTTPAEFRRRAVDAGMAADDVAELTRLFEEVRYGEGDPDVRASAAVAALRRIEASHASEGEP